MIPWIMALFVFLFPDKGKGARIREWGDFFELDRWLISLFALLVGFLILKFNERQFDKKEAFVVFCVLLFSILLLSYIRILLPENIR